MIAHMLDAYANEFGVAIVLADLGEWNTHAQLNSEYDPTVPAIRINERVLSRIPTRDGQIEFATRAVGHELYHHFEHLGEVCRFRDRYTRERIADEFSARFWDAVHAALP